MLQAQQPVLPGQIAAAPLTREAEQKLRSNRLNYGVSYSGSFDDNVETSNSGGFARSFISSVRPEIGLTLDRRRIQLATHYAAALSYSPNTSISNRLSQSAGLDFRYDFSKRLSVNAHESYVATSDPFNNLRANAELPAFGAIDGPSSAVLGTNLDTASEHLASDLTYRLSRYTSIGAGGSFGTTSQSSQERTGNPTASSSSWSGSAFVAHQISPRHTVGVQYTAQAFSADQPLSSTAFGHEVVAFWNVSWNRSLQLAFFGGPDQLQIDRTLGLAQGLSFSQTAISGGASLRLQGEYSGVSVNFTQRASDAGISSAGVVNMRSAGLNLERRLTKSLRGQIFANYVAERTFLSSATPALADSVSFGTEINRALGQRLTLSVTAMRQQFIGTIPVLFTQRNHDVAAVSISYNASRPVGR